MDSGINRFDLISKYLPLTRYGCQFRLVDVKDAEFIFDLRTNPEVSKYLNPVTGGVDDQRKWIQKYKTREAAGEDFYFISLDPKTGLRQGLTRLSDFRDKTYEAGSWIYLPDLDFKKGILGDVIAREIAFDILNFEYCTFNVRKDNKSVLKYFLLYSPKFVREGEKCFYYIVSKDAFNSHKKKVLKVLGF